MPFCTTCGASTYDTNCTHAEQAAQLASKRQTDEQIMRLEASDRAWRDGATHDAVLLVSQVFAVDAQILATVAQRVGESQSSSTMDVARALVDVVQYRSNMGLGETTPARLVREYLASER